MIWIYLLIGFGVFSLGTLFGFCLNRCPEGGNHHWEYIGDEERELSEYQTPGTYDLGGYYRYTEKVKVYKCKKCGQTKYVE